MLSKWGVARHVYLTMIKRAVVDHAVGADWTPAAGDVKISKDGGTAANVTNLPVAIAMGNGAIWDFSLTGTEMEAAQVVVTIVDTATKAVEDNAFLVETYGAGGQHAFDLAIATPSVNVTQLDGTTLASGTAVLVANINGNVIGSVFAGATRQATAQAGASGQITLDASASAVTDFYKGAFIYLTGGAGAGQGRLCTSYNGTTKVAVVDRNWATNPDSSSGFIVYPVPNAKIDTSLQTTANLTTTAVQAIWDALTSALTTSGSVGKRIADFLTGDAFVRLGAPAGASVSADVASARARLATTATLTASVLTDGGNSATQIKTSLTASGTDHFKDCLVKITSGTLAEEVKKCTGSTGTTNATLTFTSGFTATPADGVTLDIIND